MNVSDWIAIVAAILALGSLLVSWQSWRTTIHIHRESLERVEPWYLSIAPTRSGTPLGTLRVRNVGGSPVTIQHAEVQFLEDLPDTKDKLMALSPLATDPDNPVDVRIEQGGAANLTLRPIRILSAAEGSPDPLIEQLYRRDVEGLTRNDRDFVGEVRARLILASGREVQQRIGYEFRSTQA
jgi:hypothetical protein